MNMTLLTILPSNLHIHPMNIQFRVIYCYCEQTCLHIYQSHLSITTIYHNYLLHLSIISMYHISIKNNLSNISIYHIQVSVITKYHIYLLNLSITFIYDIYLFKSYHKLVTYLTYRYYICCNINVYLHALMHELPEF